MTWRSLIHRFLRSRGYDIRRYVSETGRTIPLLEYAVHARAGGTPGLYFLQVGANDGVLDDPLRPLVQRFHLQGLLVEPMPEAFQQLQTNYADQPQVAFENCALWHEDGEREMYRIRPEAYANPLVKGMASFNRQTLLGAQRHLPRLARNIETLRVRTLTVATLFSRHHVQRVDLLQVDTEGFDDEIVYMVLNGGVMPKIIHYEHIHLSPDRQDACAQFLSERGFRFARTRTDTLALRES